MPFARVTDARAEPPERPLRFRDPMIPSTPLTVVRRLGLAIAIVGMASTFSLIRGQQPCDPEANPVLCENQLPGTPSDQWDISGSGSSTIQGFATAMSVNRGETV